MFYFNSRDELFKKPFGAVKCGCEIDFTLYGGDEVTAPYLCIKKDGGREQFIQLQEKYTDGTKYFTTKYTPDSVGLYFYCFRFSHNDLNGLYNNGKGASCYGNGGRWFMQTVYDRDFKAPEEFKGRVMYQIFPDRFFEGRKKGPQLSFPDRVYREDKDGLPFFTWSAGDPHSITKDYYGGDLPGITRKADYLESLGINCIYLNPIFESHENHRYNTANYMKIDPELGTLEDFKQMCRVLHSKGIKVILDGVFSHTGSDSIYFNKESRYDTVGAYNSRDSVYRQWYDFDPKYKNGYRSWWDFPSLPDVNEMNPSYLEFICGEKGVISYWIKNGADGFRLDVADELPDEFIECVRRAVKRHGEDKLLIGEVWENAVTKESYGKRRTYLLGRGLDSVMNYPFRTAVLEFIKYGNGESFCESIYEIYESYPKEAMDTAWNSLSTHDTVRAITFLRGRPDNGDRRWQSRQHLDGVRLERGKRMLICAYALLFGLPGVPCIYYGDEIAMEGYPDPFNRGYYRWWAQDKYFLERMEELVRFHKKHRRYKEGGIYFVHLSENAVAYVRFEGYDEVLTGVNRGDVPVTFTYNDKEIRIEAMSYVNLEI